MQFAKKLKNYKLTYLALGLAVGAVLMPLTPFSTGASRACIDAVETGDELLLMASQGLEKSSAAGVARTPGNDTERLRLADELSEMETRAYELDEIYLEAREKCL